MEHLNKGSSRADWQTPDWILGLVRGVIGGPIGLDPATAPSNPTRALQFYTKVDDGLYMPWSADSIFLNPPWSRKHGLPIDPWLERAAVAAQHMRLRKDYHVFVLTSASVNSSWWHRWLAPADRHFFPRGRIMYEVPNLDPDATVPDQPSFDSALTYFGSAPERFEELFAFHGRVLR